MGTFQSFKNSIVRILIQVLITTLIQIKKVGEIYHEFTGETNKRYI